MKNLQISLNQVVIICIIFAVLFGFADYFIANTSISSYLCNLSVECLSIAITLFIIQRILEKRENDKEKELERQNIIKHNEVISVYIEHYKRFFHCVATPLGKRNESVAFPIKFEMQDMRDLHKFSGYVTNELLRPSVELFYRYEKNLRDLFIATINNIEFKYHSTIKELMLEYITISVRDDVSDFMLNVDGFQYLQGSKDEKHINAIQEIFDSPKINEYYRLYKEDKLQDKFHSHIAIPYCILYDLMNAEQNIIVQYLAEIDKIKSKDSRKS